MSEMCELQIVFPDLILRAEDDGDGRTISGMFVPWNRPTPVLKPVAGLEKFKRGAFDKSLGESKRPIPLLLHHHEDEPAAKLISHENREDGHYAVFRALDTRAGKDALELIREEVVTGLSVGGWAVPARTKISVMRGGTRVIERSEMRLDHIGLVRIPAYDDAQVLALRNADMREFDCVAAANARKRIRQRLREVI